MRVLNKIPVICAGVILLICYTPTVSAQDFHLSQYDEVQVMLNPAHTGMTEEIDYRASALYRTQWRSLVSRPYSTFALAYDMRLSKRWGFGGYLINSDGARIFNAFNLVVSTAYEITKPSQDKHEMTVGLQAGMIYRNTNDQDLSFDNQYTSGEFDMNLPSLEIFDRYSKVMPEVSMGGAYKYTNNESAVRPYLGFSLWHITSPKVAFVKGTEDASRLPRKFVVNGGTELVAGEKLLFDVKFLTMFQGQAKELLGGFQTTLLANEDYDTKLSLGAYYRHGDAVILTAGVDYLNLRFNVSYDMITSSLANYTKTGALEFTFTYQPKTSRYRLSKR